MTTGTFSAGQQVGSTTNTLAGNPGLVAIKEATFTGAASCPIYDCFSREFNSYHILYRLSTSGASNYFSFRLMNRDQVANTAVYGCANEFVIYNSAGLGAIGNNGFTEFLAGYTNGAGTISSGNVNIHNPYIASERTTADWMFNAADLYGIWGAGIHDIASRYTGFTVTHISGGTCTGYISVYGIRNI